MRFMMEEQQQKMQDSKLGMKSLKLVSILVLVNKIIVFHKSFNYYVSTKSCLLALGLVIEFWPELRAREENCLSQSMPWQ